MRILARGLVTFGLVVAATAGAALAEADPVTTSDWSSSWEGACATWWDVVVGNEPGYVTVCGDSYRTSNQYGEWEERWVNATRTVQTCDENSCTDAYQEEYWGPATSAEFSIDYAAGTADFNITLSGESDTCNVVLDLQANGPSQTTDEEQLSFSGSPGLDNGYVQAGSGSKSIDASWWFPPFGSTSVGLADSSDSYRYAGGAGTVCNWITTAVSSDWAYLQSSQYSRTDVAVTPTD